MGKVTTSGYEAERLDTIIARLQEGFRSIYGNDINVDPDSPDGQLIGLIAQIKADLEELGTDIHRQLDPDYASGAWLEQRVAYAGLTRRRASYSYLRNVTLMGTPDASIPAGYVVSDPNRCRWQLVSPVRLDATGHAHADFRSDTLGRFDVPAHTVLTIETVALGWDRAITTEDAEAGAEEEHDAALRARFFKSRAKTSTNNADSIQATLWGLPDVRHVVCLENFTDTVDAAGVPAHGINVIVEGGRDDAIAEVIYHHKTLGTNMRGEVRVQIKNKHGQPREIYFDRPTMVRCAARIEVERDSSTSGIDTHGIKQALAERSFLIGEHVHRSRLYTQINSVPGFWVTSLMIGQAGQALSEQNIPIDVRSMARFAMNDLQVIVR
ncbi:baseplate J/gp47 family protein [Xylella fastidiosa]|uniref:baseplate J/gp47 family protein n=1 Tax=Xylella fastidiosa TaxID=2371 RepID=UPI00234A1D27|nr:baseplate J/gp47 family protein [Xylella fastidiosa]KAJ4851806.1 baseplate J/gp47 family protein [Xylella fastidiosa subsp. multiplex]MDC6412025.1 baseplate J/gp47 family protein [Xylella fastidiosa subsp. multiplex]MDC6415382.1 baseplate J/gp47 family protein [Xylella fastidiosa subsp. multiplex]MDC6416952.1 baseplate J/gp47 family protein [Xylella fastidiosa subsp. multiplex]MDG4872860.1 baseplate J/gp47 family protein [Xylella fastidiosa subsp. multiplex]